VHKNIEISGAEKLRINAHIVDLYETGLSINEIRKQIGKPKTTIRSILVQSGIELRSSVPLPFKRARRESGKGSIRPYYGFCYFQGQVVADQREYENLLLIHRLWKKGANPNSIANQLNAKMIPARRASHWNRNSVVKIIKRFEDGLVALKGGQLELV
jgi:hypothetical protein